MKEEGEVFAPFRTRQKYRTGARKSMDTAKTNGHANHDSVNSLEVSIYDVRVECEVQLAQNGIKCEMLFSINQLTNAS